ncbi:MAG: hypothetical protein JNM69_09535 [Archangium sp.]|nr:hypothetical protein [Archangium sp.]
MTKFAVWIDVATALGAIVLIGVGDECTDTRISLAVFHVIPIAVVAARHGWRPALPVYAMKQASRAAAKG